MNLDSPFLVISDLQIPFEDPKALSFCLSVQKHYRIPKENIFSAGDETDQYYGGLWKKSPEAAHTANQEIQATIEKLREWYSAFPMMNLATSNHGTRWVRKAFDAEIPSQLLRKYEEVIQAPPGWKWQKHWLVKTKHPWLLEHGDDWGGAYPAVAAAMHNGISTVMGHHHTKFTLEYIVTRMQRLWAVVSGSLIDFDQYAFEYAWKHKRKPASGVTVIHGKGTTPLLIPKE